MRILALVVLGIVCGALQPLSLKADCRYGHARKSAAPIGCATILRASVSGYSACRACCGKSDGITASGRRARPGTCAAPRRFKFGTVLWVRGYGRAVVIDRGGAIRGNRLDLFFRSYRAAKQWGRAPDNRQGAQIKRPRHCAGAVTIPAPPSSKLDNIPAKILPV